MYEGAAAIPWACVEDGAQARILLTALMDDVPAMIGNARTTLRAVVVEDRVLPISINPGGETNTWTLSPRNAYVDYAAEELREVEGVALRGVLRGALGGLGAVLSAGRIDRIVHVDNWLLSTNLHPALSEGAVRHLTEALVEAFPDHAIAWRSVHAWGGEALDGQLEALGYRGVPARSVWIWDPADPSHRKGRDLKRDARLLRRGGYELVGAEALSAADAPRLEALYNALYLDKYSRHNPWFTRHFMEVALNGGLVVRALRREGRVDGVLGFFERDGMMTTPVFGYDTSLPVRTGLYRMLSAVLVQEATERGVVLHQSAGAASFKRNRHAVGVLEVTRVYDRHLPRRRRMAWEALEQSMRRIAVPLVAARGL